MQLSAKSFALAIVLALLSLAGCGRATPPPDPTATMPPPPSPTPLPTIVGPEGTPTVVPPLNPSPTPNLNIAGPLQIVELQYLQAGRELAVMAKLQNILEKGILRDANYQVLVLDASGNLLASENGLLKYVFAREVTGIVHRISLSPGMQAASVELRFGNAALDESLAYRQPFKLSTATWFSGQGNLITAWLENLDKFTYTQVRLDAIAYNARGEIVGGGTAPLAFVPELRRMGISVPSIWRESPARVELYAHLGPYSASLEGGSWWQTLQAESSGFTVSQERQLSGGAILHNRSEQILRQSWYSVAVVDANDLVCASYNGWLPVIWPRQKLVFAVDRPYIPNDCDPVYEDLTLVPGEFGTFPIGYDPLVAAQAILVAEPPEGLVRVTVVNNLNASIHGAQAHVLLIDASGKVAGGGVAILDTAAPNSSSQVDVPVSALGDWVDLRVEASVLLPEDPMIGQ